MPSGVASGPQASGTGTPPGHSRLQARRRLWMAAVPVHASQPEAAGALPLPKPVTVTTVTVLAIGASRGLGRPRTTGY